MKIVELIDVKSVAMQNKVIGYAMGLLAKTRNYSENDSQYKIDKYKLSIFFINLYKLTLLLGILAILGIFNYALVVIATYGVFRKFTMGVHMENTFICFLSDLFLNVVFVFVCVNLDEALTKSNYYREILLAIVMFLCALSAVLFYKYAPAVTKKSQIRENRKKKLRKYSFIALAATLVLCLVSVLLGKFFIYVLLILSGLAIQILNILPATFTLVEKKGW